MYWKISYGVIAALLVALTGPAFGQIGPEGWWNENIGVGLDGSVVISGDTYTITGNGHDIWDAADDFQYLYKQLVGDGSMTCRVVSNGTGSNNWAKGGVMIRANNTAGSADAYICLTASEGNGAAFQWRETQDAGAAWGGAGPTTAVAPPYWVRLEREGNVFRGYLSPDGADWTQLSSDHTVAMDETVLIGLCVTSHAAGELRTFEFDNLSWTGNVVDRAPQLKAWQPDPVDGFMGLTTPLFQWTAGETALFHKVYFGTSPDLTEADLRSPQQPFALYFHPMPLEPGVTYYWRVDEIEPTGAVHIGDVWSATATPVAAYEPQPADGAAGQLPGLILEWAPGKLATSHQVYFGMDQAAVAAGDATVDQGVLEDPEFNTGTLRASTTYYWRVDTITFDGSVTEGRVWSFSTFEGGPANKIQYETWQGIPGATIVDLTGHADYPDNPTTIEFVDAFMSPVDWADNYGQRLWGWIKPPETGDYTFWIAGDDAQELWLSSDASPTNGIRIANVPGWTPAQDWENTGGGAGDANAQMSDPIPMVAGQKYFIMALGKEATGGDSTAVAWQGPGIAARSVISAEYVDVFALPPLQAFGPTPSNGAVDTEQTLTLTWNAGELAQQHAVYFGDDAAAVAAADTASPLYMGTQNGVGFDPGSLEWGKTYAWRVDEINNGEADSPWKGAVWTFTTANFLLIENFEGYDDDMDAGTAVFQTWIDGIDNGTGSIVGHLESQNGTFNETTIVHGGEQSMLFDFDNGNAPWYSEAGRTWAPTLDLSGNGLTDLVLQVRGYPGPTEYTEDAGVFTIAGEGVDIWGTADQFTYLHKQLNGNGSMIARVVSNGTGSNTWAKGGVMIRQSLDAGSTHSFMPITAGGGNGGSFQYRPTADADSLNADVDAANPIEPPYWVKIERSGSSLTGSISPDGTTWTQLGTSQFIVMTDPVYIGLAVTSHAAGEYRTFEFDSVEQNGGVSGGWQLTEIGLTRNAGVPLYVALEDSTGNVGVVSDPTMATVTDWTEWKISLSDFGVNTARIKTMYIGAGDRDNPTPGGSGRVFIDDIRASKPAPVVEEPAEVVIE